MMVLECDLYACGGIFPLYMFVIYRFKINVSAVDNDERYVGDDDVLCSFTKLKYFHLCNVCVFVFFFSSLLYGSTTITPSLC